LRIITSVRVTDIGPSEQILVLIEEETCGSDREGKGDENLPTTARVGAENSKIRRWSPFCGFS
jgi:hypothetical protein